MFLQQVAESLAAPFRLFGAHFLRNREGRRDLLLACGVGLAAGVFFLFNDVQLSTVYSRLPGCFFGADATSHLNALLNFDALFRAARHPAFAPTLVAAESIFRYVFFFSPTWAAAAAFAFFPALNCLLVFLLARWMGLRRSNALLIAAAYGLAFANLAIFSIPESYGVTGTALLLLTLWLWGRHRLPPDDSLAAGGAAALIAAAAGWYNPPLLSALLPWTVGTGKSLRAFARSRSFALAWAGAPLVWVAPLVLLRIVSRFAPDFARSVKFQDLDQIRFVHHWASLSNYFHPHLVLSVLASSFVIGFASPIERLMHHMAADDVAGYGRSPLAAAAIAVLTCAYAAAAAAIVRDRLFRDRWFIALAAWIAAIVLFYVAWDPGESFLFASQAVTLVLVLAMYVVGRTQGSRLTAILLPLAVIAMACTNLPTLYRTATSTDSRERCGIHSAGQLRNGGLPRQRVPIPQW